MSERRAQPELEGPAWLVELAARDDPPTELEPRLLSRLTCAGVTDLRPADGTAFLDVADADRASAIGAADPGFGVIESLEDEAAPTAAALERLCSWVERYDRMRALRLAAIDMEFVASTARALADRDGLARLFERVLETGLVVTYTRPYLASNRPGLGKRWHPASRPIRRRRGRARPRARRAARRAELPTERPTRDPVVRQRDRGGRPRAPGKVRRTAPRRRR